MNIALEQTEENVNGQVTNRYGDAFIRGNNGEGRLSRLMHRRLRSRVQCCISLRQNRCDAQRIATAFALDRAGRAPGLMCLRMARFQEVLSSRDKKREVLGPQETRSP